MIDGELGNWRREGRDLLGKGEGSKIPEGKGERSGNVRFLLSGPTERLNRLWDRKRNGEREGVDR